MLLFDESVVACGCRWGGPCWRRRLSGGDLLCCELLALFDEALDRVIAELGYEGCQELSQGMCFVWVGHRDEGEGEVVCARDGGHGATGDYCDEGLVPRGVEVRAEVHALVVGSSGREEETCGNGGAVGREDDPGVGLHDGRCAVE